ncbi:MAG TPA: right-handed parallel beta-helix repeat-containing protein [Pyrinomonadaceae bacterium]|nr:right-handed parallel beta-helix repeat-containing protein [Pyrinomonadaceae bacterium]
MKIFSTRLLLCAFALGVAFLSQTFAQTPVRTPRIDPAAYLPARRPGPTIKVSLRDVSISGTRSTRSLQNLRGVQQAAAAANDLGLLLNAANKELTASGGGTISVEGGGSIKTQVQLDHHTKFDSSTYSCDVTGITDFGCFLIGDNVLVEGTYRPPQALLEYFQKGNGRKHRDPYLLAVQSLSREQLAGRGTTILEPTFASGRIPAVIVFQAKGDACCSHTERSRNIAIVGFHIRGRQQVYDGGVRSTIQFGNCERCTAQNNYLEDTASIGISFGGSALQKNYFANDCLAYHNITNGVAAANIAAVNSENVYVVENYAFRLGHHEPRFGGGVCGFDLETNSPADHSRNIFVLNNLYDYEGSIPSAGSAICLQDPYRGANHGLVVAENNIAIGGREDRLYRFMSNGFFLNGLRGCQIRNNYVFRTGQNAIQAYSIEGCVIEDNEFESTGGGGNPTVSTTNAVNNVFRRNKYHDRPGLTINTHAGYGEICGKNNVYEGNLVNNREAPPVGTRPCAPK